MCSLSTGRSIDRSAWWVRGLVVERRVALLHLLSRTHDFGVVSDWQQPVRSWALRKIETEHLESVRRKGLGSRTGNDPCCLLMTDYGRFGIYHEPGNFPGLTTLMRFQAAEIYSGLLSRNLYCVFVEPGPRKKLAAVVVKGRTHPKPIKKFQ